MRSRHTALAALACVTVLSIASADAQGPAGTWVTGKYKPVPEPS